MARRDEVPHTGTQRANRLAMDARHPRGSPWLFPSALAGSASAPQHREWTGRDLGVNLLGGRNRAIGELVLECPPSLVAKALGYSTQVAFLHADTAAEP
jgi:hypothetical protein